MKYDEAPSPKRTVTEATQERKAALIKRHEALKTQRSSWLNDWQIGRAHV